MIAGFKVGKMWCKNTVEMTSGLEITVFVILPFHIFSPLFGYFSDDDPNDNDQYNMSYGGAETAKKTCISGLTVVVFVHPIFGWPGKIQMKKW